MMIKTNNDVVRCLVLIGLPHVRLPCCTVRICV
jgi:hypothetical protein